MQDTRLVHESVLSLDKHEELPSFFRWDQPDSEARLVVSESKLAFFGCDILYLLLAEGLIVQFHLLFDGLNVCDQLCKDAATDVNDTRVAARIPRQVHSHLLDHTFYIFGLLKLCDKQDDRTV